METMERDPLYIAEQVKFIRKMHRLTQGAPKEGTHREKLWTAEALPCI